MIRMRVSAENAAKNLRLSAPTPSAKQDKNCSARGSNPRTSRPLSSSFRLRALFLCYADYEPSLSFLRLRALFFFSEVTSPLSFSVRLWANVSFKSSFFNLCFIQVMFFSSFRSCFFSSFRSCALFRAHALPFGPPRHRSMAGPANLGQFVFARNRAHDLNEKLL